MCSAGSPRHPALATAALTAGVVVDKLSSADEGGEAAHVCTMLMETLVVLLNHEVRLAWCWWARLW